ncbi:MAG TPA: APC family permease [Nocardioides sp.]|uniref:APC family permease n=1 Tax=Nocardioides sp. TaxID=35761 RepID=UPI002EDA320B
MKQDRLPRQLGLGSVVAFGLAYMAPSLVMILFGIVAVESAGAAPTTFALATGALLFTAFSYARMAAIYPVSGSAYTYARRNLGAPLGFLVGWSILLDYLFLPMVAWLTQSILLNAQFPEIPIWAWMLINAGVTTAINVAGVVLADRVNRALLYSSIGLVVLFVVVCLFYLVDHQPTSYTDPLWNSATTLTAVTGAAAIAAYSFLGYDAVTTLADESTDPGRTIPRAVILVVAIGGVIFVGVSYVMALVHPGSDFEAPEAISYFMSLQVGGQTFADWTNLAGIIAGTGSCLAVQLSSSRLLYVMGRDGVLPRRFFGRLNDRTRTPVYSLLATGAMCFVGMRLSLQTATGFINFGAFLAFTAVNLCVVAYYLRHRHERQLNVVIFVLLPLVGAAITLYLLSQLHSTALLIGSAWLCLGVGYLVWLTRAFRRPTPELSLDADPDDAAPTSTPSGAPA